MKEGRLKMLQDQSWLTTSSLNFSSILEEGRQKEINRGQQLLLSTSGRVNVWSQGSSGPPANRPLSFSLIMLSYDITMHVHQNHLNRFHRILLLSQIFQCLHQNCNKIPHVETAHDSVQTLTCKKCIWRKPWKSETFIITVIDLAALADLGLDLPVEASTWASCFSRSARCV